MAKETPSDTAAALNHEWLLVSALAKADTDQAKTALGNQVSVLWRNATDPSPIRIGELVLMIDPIGTW